MGEERDCTSASIGVTEDGVRVCARCADGMLGEGFAVTFDSTGAKEGA